MKKATRARQLRTLVRLIRLWNSLPAKMAEIISLTTFKSKLYNYLVN